MKTIVSKQYNKKIITLVLILAMLVPTLSFAGRYKDCTGHSRTACWWGDTSIKILGLELKEADGHSHPGLEACLAGN